MRVERIENFNRGWFIGNFDPTIYKTKEFEVGILTHARGEEWKAHYHTSIEINYIIQGQILMHGQLLQQGDIFVMEPYEVADPQFLTDCVIVVVKTPSLPGDKFMADSPRKDITNDAV